MKNKLTMAIIALIVIIMAIVLLSSNKKSNESTEEALLDQTYAASVEYLSLRYQTENVLENAESFGDYDSWNAEMDDVIRGWNDLEKMASDLEKIANKFSQEKIGKEIIPSALAYSKEEISQIVDKAPFGQKIMTLAKHLGTDAKHAQLILNQAQDGISREAYGAEGDVFEKCEHNSMRIKNGAKVAGFVGGIVLTGGVSGVVSSGALTTTATVVSGADLVLEITDDEAKIALGDNNKVSEFVSDVRTVTEPAAAILTLATIPGNLSSAADKLAAASFSAEQVVSVVQDQKILGISLQTNEKGEVKAEAAGLSEDELSSWREENKGIKSNESAEEIINNAKKIVEQRRAEKESEVKKTEDKKTTSKKSDQSDKSDNKAESLVGTAWSGTLTNVSGGDLQQRTTDLDFVLNKDGSVGGSSFSRWEQSGDVIKLYGEDDSVGYYEFKYLGNELVFTKIVAGDEVILSGQEFLGGIAPSGSLQKKSNSNEDGAQSAQSNASAMSASEYNELDDDGLLKDIASVIKYLGEPSVRTTDNGRIVFIYYDLVKYDGGDLGSVKMTFYNEEDYRTFVENMGASWETNKENWDESGGGIRATSLMRSADEFKKIYGE